jgi:Beta/Gamma crystallin
LKRKFSAVLAVGLAMSAVAGVARAQLALYENDNYGGRVFRTSTTVQNLSAVGFNDRASSVVVRNGRWQVCSDANFLGQCVTLEPGEYPSLGSMGLNDKLSSVRELGQGQGGWGGGGWSSARITLYENDDFKGQSVPASGNLADLANFGFNDKASSARVRDGQWQLCVDANYRGNCVTLGPGEYPTLRAMGVNDRVSSVRDLGSMPSGGTVAQLPGTVPLQGRERGYCRLTNVAYGRDQYSGLCTIKQGVNGPSILYDIKMGTAQSFKFASSDGGRTWMSGPQQVQFRDQGRTGVFRWSNFRLEVAED